MRTQTHLLTGDEVRQMLGLRTQTNHTLRLLEKRGLLHPIRLNARVVRYDPEDVQRLIDTGRSTTPIVEG